MHKVTLANVTMTVSLPKTLPIRLWVARKLFILGAFVMGCGVKITTEEDH